MNKIQINIAIIMAILIAILSITCTKKKKEKPIILPPKAETITKEYNNDIKNKRLEILKPYAEILKVSPEDIYKKIQKESSWRANAISHDRGASGLWQARQVVREEIGLPKPLRMYSIEEQLVFHLHFCAKNGWFDIVDRIPKEERGFQLWLIGFLPRYAGTATDENTISYAAYRNNKGLDLNKDRQITIKELKIWYNK